MSMDPHSNQAQPSPQPGRGEGSRRSGLMVGVIGLTLVAIALAVWFFVFNDSDEGADQEIEPRSSASVDPGPEPATSSVETPEPEQSMAEAQSPEPEESVAPPMNLDEIEQGNFSSVQGRWETSEGDWVAFDGDNAEWHMRGEQFATISGLTMTGGSLALGHDPADVAGEPDKAQGSLALLWSFEEDGYAHGSALVFVPAGDVAPDVMGTAVEADPDHDRIIILSGNAVGRLLPTEFESSTARRAVGESPESPETDSTASPTDASKDPRLPAEAGGPRPPRAKPLAGSSNEERASIITPSGNIGCDFWVSEGEAVLDCMVVSWWTEQAPVEPANESIVGDPWIIFGTGERVPFYGGDRGDPLCFQEGACPGLEVQRVEYGEMVYFRDFVCASESNGLTCWNTETGKGALMSRSSFITFE